MEEVRDINSGQLTDQTASPYLMRAGKQGKVFFLLLQNSCLCFTRGIWTSHVTKICTEHQQCT